MPDLVLRRKQVQERVAVSAATIYRWVNQGHFPKQLKLGARSVGWRKSEIDAWLAERLAR